MELSLSILSSTFEHLAEDIQRLEPYVDRLHFDVMDGHFVHAISFGLPVLQGIKTTLPIDVHLMVTNPEEQIRDFAPLADTLYIHEESIRGKDVRALTDLIKSFGKHAGITLNPETPVEEITSVLVYFTHVLIMSVHPGAGGQAYIPQTLEKISTLKKIAPQLSICVDGGMNEHTAPEAKKQGADCIVSGSYLLKAKDPAMAASLLR